MFLVISVLLTCVTLLGASSYLTEIIGGRNADIKNHRYQVALFEDGNFFCGGSVISKQHIVTAGHCMNNKNGPLTIRAGSSALHSGGVTKQVTKVYVNGNFKCTDCSTLNAEDTSNDIAILELSEDLPLGDEIGPVNLPERGTFPLPGQAATASGWGSISNAEPEYPEDLQTTILTIRTIEEGPGYVYIKASGGGSTGICYGDSGGGLVVNGVLVGINSGVIGKCATGEYDIFSSVGYLRDFISIAVNV